MILKDCTRVAILGIATILAGASLPAVAHQSTTQRQQQVEQRSTQVMPFDMNRTTHVFHELPDGGMQLVVAKDPADGKQVALIQSHLHMEANRFARGDFGDPATIHGTAMPGLSELRSGYRKIHIAYSDTTGGGHIRYTSSDPKMIAALHKWFAAQVSDHGAHAMHDMHGMDM